MHREVRDLVKRLRSIEGVVVVMPGERGHGRHPKVFKDGRFVSALPLTPSDHRSLKNARTTLRRQGIEVDERRRKQ